MIWAYRKVREALELAESVYRLNVVEPGEPSSVLRAMQTVLRDTHDT